MTDATPGNSKSVLDVRNFDKEIAGAVSDLNKQSNPRYGKPPAPKPNAPPEYRFMELTEANCEAMLEAARTQVNIANNNLKATERYVEALRQESKQRWEEHEAYVKALEDFGHKMLEANEAFKKTNGRR